MSCGVLVTDLTDHFPIFCKSHTSHDVHDNPKFRNFSNNNISNFIHGVELVDWNPILDDNNANSSYDNFCSILTSLYNECFPFIQPKNNKRRKHPWITKCILTSIKHKNKLFQTYLKNPTDINKVNYSKYIKSYYTHIKEKSLLLQISESSKWR